MTSVNNLYNRLIIVGNGFDLALGLNTAYEDFLVYYVKSKIAECRNTHNYSGDLLDIGISKGDIFEEEELLNSLNTFKNITENNKVLYSIIPKEPLMKNLWKNFNHNNWVDIENQYFKILTTSFKKTKDDYRGYELIKSSIENLNKQLDVLTDALSDYINKQQTRLYKNDGKLSSQQIKCFSSLASYIKKPLRNEFQKYIRENELAIGNISEPKEYLFVNFNYTNTVSKFVEEFMGGLKANVIQIHGSVNGNKSPIVFGYGDDTGEDYKEMENSDQNDLIRKLKSFNYLRNSNYHELLKFIEKGPFEIYIIGHSCGLSDRTMLKTIFEDKNCLAIQRFHYEKEEKGFFEDYERVMNISRHFKDKILMRKKLLHYDIGALIPQCDKIPKEDVIS